VTEAIERRERFLRVCLKAGAPPDKALAQALAMEDFVVKGTVAPLMLAPPDPRQKSGQQKTWTPEKVAEFKQMWAADANISDIAAKFNLTKQSAYQRARELGLGRRRPLGNWGRGRKANSAEAAATVAKATPASRPPMPDTSDLPPAAQPGVPEETNIEGVMRFLQSRDVHLRKDPNSNRPLRWLVEGRRDRALNAEELLSYANREKRLIGQPELVYGL